MKERFKVKFPGLFGTLKGAIIPFSNLRSRERIFTRIYLRKKWGSGESLSGPGSYSGNTKSISARLPVILTELNVRSVLDAACGDFNWMKDVPLGSIRYTGTDIVKELVENNSKLYTDRQREFICLDITRDTLPEADMIFCRDCLVHYSFYDIRKALENFKRSRAGYLMTSTFIDCKKNEDIITGGWRPLNLMLGPFSFPEPKILIYEEQDSEGRYFRDKCLGLWKLNELP